MSVLAEAKLAARKSAFARRKAAHTTLGPNAGTAALLAHLGDLTGRTIAGYMPIRTEIDPTDAMVELAQANQMVVPVIEGAGKPLSFRVWTPGCDMIAGPFGAAIPADANRAVPDTLIVPLVAFTPKRYRLGYGGGFYDRTLEELRATQATYAVGFAFAAQCAPDLPIEQTDQRLDDIVTEEGPLAHPKPTAGAE
ncbi:MAG: 5-formyltetrahydrofolate cyclo-ligase [Planctomycetota bacterium]